MKDSFFLLLCDTSANPQEPVVLEPVVSKREFGLGCIGKGLMSAVRKVRWRLETCASPHEPVLKEYS